MCECVFVFCLLTVTKTKPSVKFPETYFSVSELRDTELQFCYTANDVTVKSHFSEFKLLWRLVCQSSWTWCICLKTVRSLQANEKLSDKMNEKRLKAPLLATGIIVIIVAFCVWKNILLHWSAKKATHNTFPLTF